MRWDRRPRVVIPSPNEITVETIDPTDERTLNSRLGAGRWSTPGN
jgi:hypothetical protein